MSTRPTIRDVAAHAKVSKTTVAYVLNRRTDVAIPEATRDRVFEAARELGYRRDTVARSFATGKSQNIGMVVSYQGYVNGYQDAFVSRILYGVQNVCASRQYGLLLSAAQNPKDITDDQINSLLEQKVAGVIFVGLPEPGVIDEVVREGVACVVVDDRAPDGKADCVLTDDTLGAKLAVEHLVRLGRRRIAHLTSGTSTSTAKARAQGFESAMAGCGLDIDPNLVVAGSFVPGEALSAACRLLSLPNPPDAVFADSDYLAIAALQCASQKGLKIPSDIVMVGYADLQVAEWLDVTTIRQNAEALGIRAAERVFSRIEDPGAAHEEIVLPVELVIRGTCGGRL